MPLKEWTKKIGEQAIENLRRARPGDDPREGQKGHKPEPGTTRPNELMYLHRVAKPATIEALQRQGPRMLSIADRWACISLNQVKKLEAGNRLMEQLCLQAYAEVAALADARVTGGCSDLPESEIMELWGVDADLHLYPSTPALPLSR
jgi:hypothetical protein